MRSHFTGNQLGAFRLAVFPVVAANERRRRLQASTVHSNRHASNSTVLSELEHRYSNSGKSPAMERRPCEHRNLLADCWWPMTTVAAHDDYSGS